MIAATKKQAGIEAKEVDTGCWRGTIVRLSLNGSPFLVIRYVF